MQKLLDNMRPDSTCTDHANSQLSEPKLTFASKGANLAIETLRITCYRLSVEMKEPVDSKFAFFTRLACEARA
jgi:hypothetical protein